MQLSSQWKAGALLGMQRLLIHLLSPHLHPTVSLARKAHSNSLAARAPLLMLRRCLQHMCPRAPACMLLAPAHLRQAAWRRLRKHCLHSSISQACCQVYLPGMSKCAALLPLHCKVCCLHIMEKSLPEHHGACYFMVHSRMHA